MKNLVLIKNKHHLKYPLARNCMTSGRKFLISNEIATEEKVRLSFIQKKKLQRKYIDENIYGKKRSTTYIQNNSDTNSSTVPPFAKCPVDNFI